MPLVGSRRSTSRGLVVLTAFVIAVWSLQVEVGSAQAGPPSRSVGVLPALFPQNKTLPDLTIAHVEITQVIQRWGDASPLVPLVRGKPTVVRVYVQASGGPGPGPGGTWSVTWTAIDVYHGTTYLDTLWQQGPVLVTPGADPKSLRDNVNKTFNFLLPSSWTTFPEGLTLRVTINSQGGVPELSSSNNTVSETVNFRLTYPLTVAGLMFSDPKFPFPAKPYADFNTQLAFLNQTWPVPSTNLFTPPNQDLHYGTPSNVDASDAYFPGGAAVAGDADKRRLQATDASNGYYWYALQPWYTGLNGMACGVGTCRGATGQDTTGVAAGVVMAQEVGHNWGQYHTGHVSTDNWFDPNCCPHGGISKSLTDLAYGFDTRTMQVIPPGPQSGSHAHDFMVGGCTGGCPTLPYWVSDYTYERLLNADTIRPLGQDQPQFADALDGQQRVAAVGASSQPAETRQYMFVSGHVGDAPVLDPTYVLDRPVGTADDPGTGQFTLELRDDADEVLSARSFNPSEGMHDLSGPPSFVEILPWDERAHSLVLRMGDAVVATRTASPGSPVVNILTPRPGVHWNGARQVTWEASDPDGDELVYAVHYSSDGGRTWLPVGIDLTDTSLDIDAGLLKGSTDCHIRVIASDGFNTTIAESEPFGVDPHDPSVTLTFPPQLTGRQVILRGTAYDADDGAFPEESMAWTSSLDGALGTGSTVVTTPLSPGHHTITLRVVDADGHTATATASLDVPNTPTKP